METKKSRMLTLLACLFVLFTNHVQAQDNDELQRLIDLVASAPITRAGETVREIDLSPYTEPRTTTLYIRNGANVRFVNGTLTRSTSFTDGPLITIQTDSQLELSATSELSGNNVLTSHSVVNVENGILTIKGGKIGDVYGWANPSASSNGNTAVELSGGNDAEFRQYSGEVLGRIDNKSGGYIIIDGGIVYRVSTSESFSLSGNAVIKANVYFYKQTASIRLYDGLKNTLHLSNYEIDQLVLLGDSRSDVYSITTSDVEKLELGGNDNNYSLSLEGNSVYVRENKLSPIQTIENVEPGTLLDRIPEAARDIIEELTITGKLNGTDIVLLQEMAKQKLRKLNISGCDIVKGGSAYYTSSGTYATNYFTANDEIGSHMFYQSTSLETVILPNSITKLNGSSFHYGSVKSITIGPKVKTIDGGLCPGANIEEIILNNNSSYILDGGILYDAQRTTIYRAVVGVTGEIIIPNNITTIENSAFDNCSHITKVTLPSNLTEIETACFSDCTALIEVLFNKNLSYLGYDCFGGCSSLKTVDLSNTKVYYIYQSFYGCNAIETLLLPSTIETIWGTCFTSTHLNYISCPAVIPPTLSHADKTFSYSYIRSFCKVVVPTNSITAYKTADGWKNFLKYESDKDPNYIESEDDLQKRLDEIAAENPSKPVTLTIQDNGITINNTIVANEGCNAIITGGKITVNKNFNFKSNCIFDNWGNLTFENITIDGSSIFFENEFFMNFGTLTISNDVKYENIYQGELRYGFYVSTGTLIVYSGDLTLNGPIIYPSHGGKVFVYGGNFQTLNSKKIISGDDTVTILGATFSGGPINMRNLNLGDMEADGIPDLNVSSINTSNINIYRVMKLPLINLSADGVMTLDWHYRVWHSLMEYQGKWSISSEWAKMELERPFVVSGYNDYPMTQDDFNNFEFIDMPNDREAYFDEATKSVKLMLKKDPNYIESEDDLQKRLDEIAEEKPKEPITLTIREEGITLTKSIRAEGGCKAIITGGKITVASSVINNSDYILSVRQAADIQYSDITFELPSSWLSDLSHFVNNGSLTLDNAIFICDKLIIGGECRIYGYTSLPMLYLSFRYKSSIKLLSTLKDTWIIDGEWGDLNLDKPYTIVSGYNYTVTKADYSKMQFANLPDDMEAVYNEDLKVVQLQKREVECDLQSLVDGLCDAAPGGNVPAPTDGVDIGCDDAPDPLQCAVDIIIDGGEENVNPNDLKTICLCQAGPDVVIEKPAIRVNPYSTLTISNYNIRSDKYENQSFLVRGTLIIDVNVHIYHFIRFIHIMPGGRVVWRGGHVEDVDEIVYNEGGTLVIEGDFDNGGKCFVNPEGGTLTIKNGSFNGNIENHGTLIIEGGEITGKVENSGTFTMTGGVVSNTVVNSTEVVFKNYGTFYFTGGIIGGYGCCLIYHAKGAVLRIEGGQFDFSHVTDYWIEAHDDFYIPGNYDFKPTVPMLIEPKVIVRVLYKWIYKFNIVFVGGRPEPRHPLFWGDDFTLTKDHFKFIDWQLPNKRWRWHLNVADNTIEPRDEQVMDEDDLKAYVTWLDDNKTGEAAGTEASPQELDLQERTIVITEPVYLPVGCHVHIKDGNFAPKGSWTADKMFYVPSGSSMKMENTVVDLSSSVHYIVSGKPVQRYIFDVVGNLHFGPGCHIKGWIDNNIAPTDTYIPGAVVRIDPNARLYLDGGRLDDVVIYVNSIVNIYVTVNWTSYLNVYVPVAHRKTGFRFMAPQNGFAFTRDGLKQVRLLGAGGWTARPDAAGYASLLEVIVGDVDESGALDAIDVTELGRYLGGRPSPSFVVGAADFNKDGVVNIVDIVQLIRQVTRKP